MGYLVLLLRSELPFASWIVIAAWLLLFIANHLLARATRTMSARQAHVTVVNHDALRRASQPRFLFGQVLFAGVVFALTLYSGDRPVFVFLGGGMLVGLICTLGLNLQALLSAQAMMLPGAAEGSLQLSTASAFRQLVHRLTGSAFVCAMLGVLLAHLALLGGALLLGSTALGYRRRLDTANRAIEA